MDLRWGCLATHVVGVRKLLLLGTVSLGGFASCSSLGELSTRAEGIYPVCLRPDGSPVIMTGPRSVILPGPFGLGSGADALLLGTCVIGCGSLLSPGLLVELLRLPMRMMAMPAGNHGSLGLEKVPQRGWLASI
jgi:hypothetical protein